MPENIWNNEKLIEILKKGGVVVMPTDTIYGIVGRAEDVKTVERIYDLKKRAPEKPCIILISDIKDLEKFSVTLSQKQKEKRAEYWPGPVSIILDCEDEKFSYLHRGTRSLAFRMPNSLEFKNLLLATGPLIAPSANPEGLTPAKNIKEAEKYFGTSVDLYIDGGELASKASKIIKLHKDGSVITIRD